MQIITRSVDSEKTRAAFECIVPYLHIYDSDDDDDDDDDDDIRYDDDDDSDTAECRR